VTVSVVGPACLGIREDLVGLGKLLEAFLGAGIAWVGIGVVVAGQPAVGFLYLRLRSFAGQSQDLVVVALSARQAALEP
jgi:hypothetical protein